MNRLSQSIARRIKRLAGIVIAGILVVVNVACSTPNLPAASATGTSEQAGDKKDLYSPTQPRRDDMNGYDDDVRAGSPKVQTKARALIDNAQRNLQKTEDPKEIPSKVRKSVENLNEDLSEGVNKQNNVAQRTNSVTGTSERAEDKKDLYSPTQPRRDDMNGYDDDVRAASPKVQTKARALIDNAQRNLQKTEDPKEIPTKVLKSAENLNEDLSEGVKKQKNEIVKGTKEGVQNLKENLEQASREIPEVIKEGTENAKSSVKKSAESVKEAVDTLKQNVDRTL